MSDWIQYSSTDSPIVFDGKRLHKKAFYVNGKHDFAAAALLAGELETSLSKTSGNLIIDRMNLAKKGFVGKVRHILQGWWLQRANSIGIKNTLTNQPLVTFDDMLKEMETNARMESFQNFYNLCYKEAEYNKNVKSEYESRMMLDLKVQYLDNTLVGGCVGDLVQKLTSEIVENIQFRSKSAQGLHVVKSKRKLADDGKNQLQGSSRRKPGDYYIVRSNPIGKVISYDCYNVRTMSE